MPEYTLKVRRYQPETGEGPYWQEFKVDLDPDLSVLDGLLQVRDRTDGTLVVRSIGEPHHEHGRDDSGQQIGKDLRRSEQNRH